MVYSRFTLETKCDLTVEEPPKHDQNAMKLPIFSVFRAFFERNYRHQTPICLILGNTLNFFGIIGGLGRSQHRRAATVANFWDRGQKDSDTKVRGDSFLPYSEYFLAKLYTTLLHFLPHHSFEVSVQIILTP